MEIGSVMSRDIRVRNIYDITNMNGQVLNDLRAPLRNFVRTSILQDGPSTANNIRDAVDRLMADIEPSITSNLQVSVRRGKCTPR